MTSVNRKPGRIAGDLGNMEGGGECLVCGSSDCPQVPGTDFLSQDLHVYFILRHVLELPLEQLQTYMRSCPNLQSWVKICLSCEDSYVKKCKRIFTELLEVKRRFQVARNEMVEIIRKSALPNQKVGKKRQQEPFVLDICKETREFVQQHGYQLPEQDPFSSGDLMAAEKVKNITRKIKIEDLPSSSIDFDDMDDRFHVTREGTPGSQMESISLHCPAIGCLETVSSVKLLRDHIVARHEKNSKPLLEVTETLRLNATPLSESENEVDNSKSEPENDNDPSWVGDDNEANPEDSGPSIHQSAAEEEPEKTKISEPDRNLTSDKEAPMLPSLVTNQKVTTKRSNPDVQLEKSGLVWTTQGCSKKGKRYCLRRTTSCPAEGCSKVVIELCDLRKHIKAKHGNDVELIKEVDAIAEQRKRTKTTQECDMCGARVPFPEILEHVQGHVGDYAVKCPNDKCPHVFTNSLPYTAFHRNACTFKRYLSEDERKKMEKKEFLCETCLLTFSNKLTLKVHVQQEHEIETAPWNFPCPITNCDQRFCVRQSVDFHLSTHNLRPVTSQKCDLCRKKVSIGDMVPHLKESHQVTDIISCTMCPCVFPSRLGLIEHFFEHRYEGLTCDLCQDDTVKYAYHKELVAHYAKVHQLDAKTCTDHVPAHICHLCGKSYPSGVKLSKHLQNSHKPHKYKPTKPSENNVCETCGEVLTSKQGLKQHMLIHTDERPLECELCGQRFRLSSDLKVHLRRHANKGEDFKPRGSNKGERKRGPRKKKETQE